MKVKPTFDEYIANCEDFAQPILKHIRKLVHQSCPDVQEAIKWNFPCFVYKGANMAYTAGFKNHATFGINLAEQMTDSRNVFIRGEKTGMWNFGKLTSIEELPSDEIILEYLHEAILLHDQGVKLHSQKAKPTAKFEISEALIEALKKQNMLKQFETFSTYYKNEYAEWISDAKTESTRGKRIAQAIQYISEGKPRNWKYMKQRKKS